MAERRKTPAETFVADAKRAVKRLVGDRVLVMLDADGDDVAHVFSIDAPRRGTGDGDAVLSKLTALADRHGVRLTLEVSYDRGTDDERLLRWYGRHGFAIVEDQPFGMGTDDNMRIADLSRPVGAPRDDREEREGLVRLAVAVHGEERREDAVAKVADIKTKDLRGWIVRYRAKAVEKAAEEEAAPPAPGM